MQNPKEDKVSDTRTEILDFIEEAGCDFDTAQEIMRKIDVHVQSEVRQAEKIATGLQVKGIEEYRKFKGSDDEIERTVAWINQLSPWNLQRAVDHLKDRFKLQPPNTKNKE